jgi:hypothetical protein
VTNPINTLQQLCFAPGLLKKQLASIFDNHTVRVRQQQYLGYAKVEQRDPEVRTTACRTRRNDSMCSILSQIRASNDVTSS